MAIHPTAIIAAEARIDASAEIGPYVVIDGHVRIGARTKIMPHAVLLGWTTIGADNVIHSGAVIGDTPQDKAYAGAQSFVVIGDGNVLREQVQVHRGTAPGSATVIGNGTYLMATAHVAHNCRVADDVVIANGSMLGGHVDVAERAFIGGNCAVHQHVRIGRLSFLRGGSRADKDVPPFAMLDELNVVRGLNLIGLKRAGFDAPRIRKLKNAFRILFGRRRNLSQAIAELQQHPITSEVAEVIAFIRASQRGVGSGPARHDRPLCA